MEIRTMIENFKCGDIVVIYRNNQKIVGITTGFVHGNTVEIRFNNAPYYTWEIIDYVRPATDEEKMMYLLEKIYV